MDSSGEQSHAEKSGGESGRGFLAVVVNGHQMLTVWQSKAVRN
jgi:hypothetical protein